MAPASGHPDLWPDFGFGSWVLGTCHCFPASIVGATPGYPASTCSGDQRCWGRAVGSAAVQGMLCNWERNFNTCRFLSLPDWLERMQSKNQGVVVAKIF